MKKWLPETLKRWLWFVFKSPQRRMAGWGTLFTDIKGWLSLLFHKKGELRPVSICTGLKNRSQSYLDHVIASLSHVKHPELIELSVFDCASDDVPDLEKRIRSVWKGKLIWASEPAAFSRSVAFNRAIDQASGPCIFACDADISIPHDIVEKVNHYITSHTVWFPLVYWLDKKGRGRYFTEGTGMFAALKQQFNDAGKYDETITEWGKEDWLLYFAFYRKKIRPLRTEESEMIHHWHPSSKPENFTPLF